MPFHKRAVVTATNEDPTKNVRSFYYHIDYTEEPLPEKAAYFCAQYRDEFPEKTGADYLILDAEGEGQLLFQPASENPEIEVDFQVEKEEYRGLILRFTHSEDFGIYRIYLDGKNVRQPADTTAGQKLQDYDFFSRELQVKDSYLGSFKLAPGKHTLRLEGRGKNLFSTGHNVGLDSIRLRERWIKKRKFLG